jgi:RHH-type proline utilization regulon transcriptional repressor/proline dehydrogenase/delta 1-pyrroline-5-carboxylate dehydrogenase
VIGKGGEPLIRQGVHRAMKLMGEQFVTGQHIAEALANSRATSKAFATATTCWARPRHRGRRPALPGAYEQAIHAIGAASDGRGIFEGPGISIKLSALHPRYSRAQYERVMAELLPRVLHLAELARRYDIGMNIDAEEADRLELSLDLLEALCAAPLKGWNGIGFVVQAYQKRCPQVIDYLSTWPAAAAAADGAPGQGRLLGQRDQARADRRPGRLPGLHAQGYTDVSYLACARKLLEAPDAVYPQFATHNAQTLASISIWRRPWAAATTAASTSSSACTAWASRCTRRWWAGRRGKLARPCRIYAPVGNHETLLAYLVRRLLENGANTSFVNRIGDAGVPVAELVADPVEEVLRIAPRKGAWARRTRASRCRAVRGQGALARANSQGFNLAHEQQLASLSARCWPAAPAPGRAPGVAPPVDPARAEGWQALANPAELADTVGWVREAAPHEVQAAAERAAAVLPIWAGTPPAGAPCWRAPPTCWSSAASR